MQNKTDAKTSKLKLISRLKEGRYNHKKMKETAEDSYSNKCSHTDTESKKEDQDRQMSFHDDSALLTCL